MRKEYGIFYHYQKNDDRLIIAFNDLEITRKDKKNDIEINYHDKEVVNYTIYHINKIMKIHIEGLISLPNEEMINVINSLLLKEGLETLKVKDHSDYQIGIVKEIEPSLIVECDGALLKFNLDDQLKVNDKVVVAKAHSFLFDGRYLKEDHLCTYKDLEISESLDLIIDNSLSEKDGFFMMGE